MRMTWMGLAAIALAGCDGGSEAAPPLATYEAGDACHENADEAGCNADPACGWVAIEACPAGADCPDGFCSRRDECAAHEDQASCEADASCAWADIALAEACPAPDCGGGGGVCYSTGGGGGSTGDCLCACPAFCGADGVCPPCECDCPPPDGGGGGGTCTCACPECAPGETCPPCDCECMDDGGGDTCGGTCTCDCPPCAPGETCEPCGCACDGGEPAPAPAPTCACPECAPGESCPPCDCPTTEDPCAAHVDETACTADTSCVWYGLGAPCVEGEACRSGVCQSASSGGDGGCVCACPACEPGTECPPCDCDCSGGSTGTGCVAPDSP